MRQAVEEIDLCTGIFLLKQGMAVVVRNGTPPYQDWRIRFYSYDGDFMGELKADHWVFNVTDTSFSELLIETDIARSEFPYSEYRYSYWLIR